ncbi:MAG: helix-turn-helix transcriptional regulator [Veillonella sp.]|nr:helix-turn-helix transcriptional regulator [Veillonella sp.]
MDYFHYTYKHNHIDFNSDIYKVSTYHYNWHSGVEVLILLKGRIDMSCNSEVFTMEPLDTIIISPQVGHATLALEEDTTALVIHVSKEFFQYFDPNFGMYQFVLRSDKTNRDNEFFTSLRYLAAQMMLLMVNSESPDRQLWLESHFLAMTSDIYREIDAVKTIPIHTKPADMTVATFDKMIAYIDENYKQKIELEDIAVAHIASSCGFADIKAFNVAFKKHFHTTPSEYRKQAKEMGRKTKLHDWKEIISTQEEDIIDILQTYLPYQDVSIDKNRLDEANQKLQDVRDQLEMVVKRLQS